jgi:hypothetical protein
MVVETALAEFQRCGDIVHGRGIVPLLLKQTSRGAEDLLARVERGFSGHGKNIHGRGHRGLAELGRDESRFHDQARLTDALKPAIKSKGLFQ